MKIEPPDVFFLNAADGWIDLDDLDEAEKELKNISIRLYFHQDVLMVYWEIYARRSYWLSAFAVAQALVAVAPTESVGWINSAFALHTLGRTGEARDLLLRGAPSFPDDVTIAYNLSCFSCVLGDLDASERWLKIACTVDRKGKVIADALVDPDLAPMRARIQSLHGTRKK